MAAWTNKSQFNSKGFQYIIDVDFQLSSFYEYIRITEETIEKEVSKKLLEYERVLKEAIEEDIEPFVDFADYETKINTQQLYYNSIFISIYSFLERKMLQLCKFAEPNYSIKINDLSGEGVVKFEAYLKKVVGIDMQKLNTEWEQIKKFNILRNHLVHSVLPEVVISENTKKKIKMLKSIKGLTFKENEEIFEFQITDKKILIDFCKIIGTYLDGIYLEKG